MKKDTDEKHGNDLVQQYKDDNSNESTPATYKPLVPFPQLLKYKNISPSHADILEIFSNCSAGSNQTSPLIWKILKGFVTIKRHHNVHKSISHRTDKYIIPYWYGS